MALRAGGIRLLAPAALACAAALGVVAGIQPLIAVGVVAGIVFACAVFADLAAGFAVLAFISFLDTLPTSGALSLAKGAGLLVAIAWLAKLGAGDRDQRDFFADHPQLTWILIAFLGWSTLSLLWATNAGMGIAAVSRYLPNILLLPIAYSAIRTRRDLVLVAGAVVLGAVLAASFGILQPPDSALIEESSRATGTVGDPNELAAFLLVGLGLAAGFALGRTRSPAVRLGASVAAVLCVGGVFLSLSRGGLVALAAMMLAGTLFAGRWRLAIALITLCVATGGVLYFTQLAPLPARERVTKASGGTGRSDLWTIGVRMVKAHPVTGVGAGNFQAVSANYVLQPGTITRGDLIFSSAPKVTHNTYLEIMAEEGLPGFLLFACVVASCLACALKAARLWAARNEASMEALARGIFLGLIGMLVADFFISNMYTKLLWVMLALCPAALGVAQAEARARPATDEARAENPVLGLASPRPHAA